LFVNVNLAWRLERFGIADLKSIGHGAWGIRELRDGRDWREGKGKVSQEQAGTEDTGRQITRHYGPSTRHQVLGSQETPGLFLCGSGFQPRSFGFDRFL